MRKIAFDIVQRSPSWAWISPNHPEFERLRKELIYKKVRWEPAWWGKKRVWRKKIIKVSMISERGWFLSGLLGEIEKRYPYLKIRKMKLPYKLQKINLNGIQLRSYQNEAIHYSLEHQRGIIHIPTGGGKTIIAAGIIASVQDFRCLFIVHTRELLHQQYLFFSRFFPTRIWGGGQVDYYPATVTIATVQTLSRWDENEIKNLREHFDGIMVDEAHHSHSDTYRRILIKSEIPFRIGLTATPHTLWTTEEYMKACGVIGPIIYEAKVQQLTQQSYLSQPIVLMVKTRCPVYGSWYWVRREGIIENEQRNKTLAHLVELLRGRKILISVDTVEQGKILASLVPGARLVQGKTPRRIQHLLRQALNHQSAIVIATTVWKEGIDIPQLDVLVVAGGGRSRISVVQRAGRLLRPKDTNPLLIDCMDYGNDYLASHSQQRFQIYRALGWNVIVGNEKEIERKILQLKEKRDAKIL
ncbi:MAG TPA: DEAD/DEAH box helicase [Thermococcus sp.]|nr:DEAD/DEAH box helicase [Thermococcus sp.]